MDITFTFLEGLSLLLFTISFVLTFVLKFVLKQNSNISDILKKETDKDNELSVKGKEIFKKYLRLPIVFLVLFILYCLCMIFGYFYITVIFFFIQWLFDGYKSPSMTRFKSALTTMFMLYPIILKIMVYFPDIIRSFEVLTISL